jgi:hypothetical protein
MRQELAEDTPQTKKRAKNWSCTISTSSRPGTCDSTRTITPVVVADDADADADTDPDPALTPHQFYTAPSPRMREAGAATTATPSTAAAGYRSRSTSTPFSISGMGMSMLHIHDDDSGEDDEDRQEQAAKRVTLVAPGARKPAPVATNKKLTPKQQQQQLAAAAAASPSSRRASVAISSPNPYYSFPDWGSNDTPNENDVAHGNRFENHVTPRANPWDVSKGTPVTQGAAATTSYTGTGRTSGFKSSVSTSFSPTPTRSAPVVCAAQDKRSGQNQKKKQSSAVVQAAAASATSMEAGNKSKAKEGGKGKNQSKGKGNNKRGVKINDANSIAHVASYDSVHAPFHEYAATSAAQGHSAALPVWGHDPQLSFSQYQQQQQQQHTSFRDTIISTCGSSSTIDAFTSFQYVSPVEDPFFSAFNDTTATGYEDDMFLNLFSDLPYHESPPALDFGESNAAFDK